MKQIHDREIRRLVPPNSISKAVLISSASLLIYLIITVVTTPSLLPLEAIKIAFVVNWWVIIGLTLGIGIQTFLISNYSRVCNLKNRKLLAGGTGFFSGVSSFLSFFALIPVGCCGSWLYIISFLPGVVGTGAAGFLVRYSNILSATGILLIILSIVYTSVSLRIRMTQR